MPGRTDSGTVPRQWEQTIRSGRKGIALSAPTSGAAYIAAEEACTAAAPQPGTAAGAAEDTAHKQAAVGTAGIADTENMIQEVAHTQPLGERCQAQKLAENRPAAE